LEHLKPQYGLLLHHFAIEEIAQTRKYKQNTHKTHHSKENILVHEKPVQQNNSDQLSLREAAAVCLLE